MPEGRIELGSLKGTDSSLACVTSDYRGILIFFLGGGEEEVRNKF